MRHKIISPLLILLNTIGLICLIYFSIPYCTHDTYVANPDAMLPIEAWDGSGMVLTIGLLPMIIANTSGFLFILKKETKPSKSPYLKKGLFDFGDYSHSIII